jgi:aldehyde:ferredoxin oxidoreductase
LDLGSGQAAYRDLAPERLRAVLGGIGLGTSLLHEYAPAGVDPLSAANPLIFASAPLVGTALTTTAKFALVTKSPLTGFIADSLSSSGFALALKRLGVDAIVITGRAASLACLVIDGERIELRDAANFRGCAARDVEARLRGEFAGGSVAAIGLAGENLVRFATVSNEGRHAGRGGAGAVMGAKNLKAIAVRGDRETPVADPKRLESLAERLRRRSQSGVTDKYRKLGTVANVSVFNRVGTLPTRNFRQATFDEVAGLTGEALTDTHFTRRHGCASCTIRCERLFRSHQPGGGDQRLEYETLFALGPLCGVSDPDAVLDAAALCDRYGLDTISAGGTIAWAMETSDRGLMPGIRDVDLAFGSADGLLGAIEAIANRRGPGDLLAEGCKRASAALGAGTGEWAMHVKGLELPGYEPRSLKTMALGLAVSPRGACHNRSGAYEADFSGAVDRLRGDSARGAIVAASEDFAAVLDSLIVCKFLRKCFDDFYVEAADVLSSVTGWSYTGAELRLAGERIHTLKKLFNTREGWEPQDDWLPPRLLKEPLPDGPATGVALSCSELREMLTGYYRARGWTGDGFVPASKRNDLEL